MEKKDGAVMYASRRTGKPYENGTRRLTMCNHAVKFLFIIFPALRRARYIPPRLSPYPQPRYLRSRYITSYFPSLTHFFGASSKSRDD